MSVALVSRGRNSPVPLSNEDLSGHGRPGLLTAPTQLERGIKILPRPTEVPADSPGAGSLLTRSPEAERLLHSESAYHRDCQEPQSERPLH